ncbi:MAG: hypothetical protein Q4G36_11515 [Paracoccus sp. (in: a-proteobacteria)]|nr:hypothetical protein [Paracoccus sp. (in: a-proteobacteria)]
MPRLTIALGLAATLAGCGMVGGDRGIVSRADAERREAAGEAAAPGAATMPSEGYTAPAPVTVAAPVVTTTTSTGRLGGGGASAAQLDTTSAEERQAAAAAPAEPAGEQRLGSTVASLGDPTDAGFWLKTPLVSATTPGRITYRGKSANVELRPLSGPASGGSQISLPAMQLLGIGLTDLPEIEVFRR